MGERLSPAVMSKMLPIVYDARLVEQVVLEAAGRLAPEAARSFHAERERIYEVANLEQRELRFRALFDEWFRRLALGRPLEVALAETPLVLQRAQACRVARAARSRDEGADLFDLEQDVVLDERASPGDGALAPRRVVFVRLRSQSFMDAAKLLALLRHEFLHLADMLDPAFGYQRELPPAEAGPAHDQLVRSRYRVLWDVTIDGRLVSHGLAACGARARRLNEFCDTFALLGGRAQMEFERWFHTTRPTHEHLVEFARNPGAQCGAAPTFLERA
jgi:hypothetical protein